MKLVSPNYREFISPEGFCNNIIGKHGEKKIRLRP